MSELRSVLDSLRAENLAGMPDSQIEQDFLELHAAMEGLELERLRRLRELERRGTWARDGHLSAGAWLRAVGRTSAPTAQADL